MKSLRAFILCCIVLTCAFTMRSKEMGTANVIQHFKSGATLFGQASNRLKASIQHITPSDSLSIQHARLALAECRLEYKRIEYFLEHFIPVTARPFNLAPVYEVEEPFMEYQQPRGMQLIEAILFSDNIAGDLNLLKENAELVSTYANDLHAMIPGIVITDEQVIESLRMELLRIITLHITGFDAPELKSGIKEAYESIFALEEIIRPYTQQASAERRQQVNYSISACLILLKANPDFNSFNRLKFMTEAALPLQNQLNLLYSELFPQSSFQSPFNIKASSVFSSDALNAFHSDHASAELVELGRSLFFEKQLSGNGRVSCGSCHDPRQYFTDGLAKSKAFRTGFVDRNSPTLLYASMQHGLFWDARAKSTDDQISEVLQNRNEMNADVSIVLKHLKNDKRYQILFAKAFPTTQKDSLITFQQLTNAISAYERTLNPMNSDFDRYISGDRSALSSQQIRGFNLFNGKAQCGTCHFAPLFNGLLPPEYALTELEVLGVTANTNFKKPLYDKDSGRYSFFPIEYNMRAFKTPTVRNIAKTAPYMHNGSFKTLEQVMDFYNKGGGEGLGLNIQHQTLSSKPLELSQDEIGAVIAFMNSLTDNLTTR